MSDFHSSSRVHQWHSPLHNSSTHHLLLLISCSLHLVAWRFLCQIHDTEMQFGKRLRRNHTESSPRCTHKSSSPYISFPCLSQVFLLEGTPLLRRSVRLIIKVLYLSFLPVVFWILHQIHCTTERSALHSLQFGLCGFLCLANFNSFVKD